LFRFSEIICRVPGHGARQDRFMQYFVVMIDYGRLGREAIVDPEVTRREVVSRVASGEYRNISFIHEIAEGSVEDVTETILTEAALPEVPARRCRSPGDPARSRPRPAQARADVTQAGWNGLRRCPAGDHTVRTVDPVVLRAARSACALAAFFSG
jgi:hypothetical protein